MRLIKEDTHIDFMGKWKLCVLGSGLAILAGIVGYFPLNGFNYGVDFRGGTVIQLQFPEPPSLAEIRQKLSEGNIGAFELQSFGGEQQNEVLISVSGSEADESLKTGGIAPRIQEVLAKVYPNMQVRRVESVGPKVGNELKIKAAEAVLLSLVAMLIYVWFRFEWRWGVSAVLAILHDVLVVLAAFILTQKEITLTVIAAVLTIAGYSINDTIVIMDRVRENVRKYQKKPLIEILNDSVNQTLSRTILTSGTVFLVVVALFFFGGEIIHDFAFAMLIGVVVGTYSSIYIASPLVLVLNQWFPPHAK